MRDRDRDRGKKRHREKYIKRHRDMETERPEQTRRERLFQGKMLTKREREADTKLAMET